VTSRGDSVKGKHVVAVVGIAGAVILGVANLHYKGPDATIITGIVAAITFIVGLAFGRRL